MVNLVARICIIIFLLAVSTAAAEVYTLSCENCDYADEGFIVGIGEDGETVSPGVCPVCKELFPVFLKKGDSEGEKEYKCPLCKDRLYLYRNPEGEPLTEPETGEKYQCPCCGSYGLFFEMKPANDETGEGEICPDESENTE